MINKDFYKTAAKLLHTYTYRHKILSISAGILALITACFLSYTAGRRGAAVSDTGSGSVGAGSLIEEALPSGAPLATPSFAFPPYASYSDATASNAEIMQPYVLNLSSLYEQDADSGAVAESYAGQLYSRLAALDAQWFSGLYELYNYTPQRMAALLGIPIESVTARSGVIPEFKTISLQIINGDSQDAGSASNRKEIISMANVLHYYGGLKGLDEMKAYAEGLWNASHLYTVSVGAVYYCDGSCLDGNPNGASVWTTDSVSELGLDGSGTASPSDAAGQSASPSDGAGQSASPSDGAGQSASPSDAAGQTASPSDAAGQTASPSDAAGQSASPSDGAGQSASPSDGAGQTASPSDGAGQTAASACPGHVDCSIVAMVRGVAETKGLFQTASATPSNGADLSAWPGWNKDTMTYARELSKQDWYVYYGFNITDFPMADPLSSQEIDLYMRLVPSDASDMRKGFIRYALSSVGKIPYYWGGKPAAPGYTGNRFGTPTSPDVDGRLLKGLDCSGWINWVYWSVTGRGLGAQSTGTLLGSGKPVSRDQLQPGDICIRTGPMSHVVIFLGWTEDGQMLCIQETTGNANNVIVGTTGSEWQSYRRILE